jgi:hypothetical protein
MAVHRAIPVAILVLLSSIVAACSGASASASVSPPSIPPSSAPSATVVPTPSGAGVALLLKVTSEGGFINPAATLAALPTVAVYSDGRIMTPGPVDAIFPGPLVAPVAVRDVGPAGAAAILDAIRTAGLDKPAQGDPGIAVDSGTNVFTVVVDGVTTTSRYAGGGPAGGPGPVASGDEGRTAALALLDRLLDPAEAWGAATAPESTYQPLGYRIFVAPGAPATDGNVTGPPVAWPLTTPLSGFGTLATPDRGIPGLRQGALLGADAAAVGPVLQRATSQTTFTSDGSPFTLYVRALLPDELGG